MNQKLDKLKEILVAHERVAVAFSGGVDSTFLLAVAHETLGSNVLAITERSILNPRRESNEALAFCQERGIRQIVLEGDPLAVPGFAENTPDRCYVCKRHLLQRFLEAAAAEGMPVLLEGSNIDDEGDYRPGTRAVRELGVASPLREAGLNKAEIRELSSQMGLPTWDKPSFACLASRFPYGDRITAEGLARVDAAEQALLDAGFTQVRVRMHGDAARIEVPPAQMDQLYAALREDGLTDSIKRVGFAFVALDMEGYRTGSMNVGV